MNLDHMRKHNSSESLSKFLNSRMYTYPDQEAINHIFKGKIKKPWDKNHKDKRDVDLWNLYHMRDL